MKITLLTFQPMEERASRSHGTRIGSTPNNQEPDRDGPGECPSSQSHTRPVTEAHDTTEACHAVDVVPKNPAGMDLVESTYADWNPRHNGDGVIIAIEVCGALVVVSVSLFFMFWLISK